jgi:hypothetical protein
MSPPSSVPPPPPPPPLQHVLYIQYAAVVVGSFAVAIMLVGASRRSRSKHAPLRMSWVRTVDIGLGLVDFSFKCAFFGELYGTGPMDLTLGCACTYVFQLSTNTAVVFRLLSWHKRQCRRATHEGNQLLGIATMRETELTKFLWSVILFLSCLSPAVIVAWPWRKRSFSGFPRIEEAVAVISLMLLDDVPQIALIALAAGSGREHAATGTGSCMAASAAGLSPTQIGSLSFAVLSVLWRAVSRVTKTLLSEDRSSGHLLAARREWAFQQPAIQMLKNGDCDELIPCFRQHLRAHVPLTYEQYPHRAARTTRQ